MTLNAVITSPPKLVLQLRLQTFSESGRSSTKKSAPSFAVMAIANPETFLPTRSTFRGKIWKKLVNFMILKFSNFAISTLSKQLRFIVITNTFLLSYWYSYSPHWSPYISFVTDKENLLDNQELPKLVIISFILTTFTFDSRVIPWGEFRNQSILGAKGLKSRKLAFRCIISLIS